jgi:hypothetical protein
MRVNVTPPGSFFVQALDLLHERIDFLGCKFAGEFGHMAFAIRDDTAQVICGRGGNFIRDERWSAEMATLGSFTMAFGAVLGVDGVRGQGRVRWESLCEDRSDCEDYRTNG